jgi:hypothetical protein
MLPSFLKNKFSALQEYDKGVESNPRPLLVRKNCSQNTSHIVLQPQVFDIYLCDNCDGEFDSLIEVQVHFFKFMY